MGLHLGPLMRGGRNDEMIVTKRVVLRFPRKLVDQPIMCCLARKYDLDFNILKASVTPNEEGILIVELSGENKDYERGEHYLSQTGVEIQPLSKDVIRNEDKCIHCGSCVVLCAGGALNVDRTDMKTVFDHTKCIVCEICVRACPFKAMEICF